MDSIKFITLTNNGYIDYTLNCLKSLELIDFQQPLHCYAIGEECYNTLQSKKYKSTLLKSDDIEDTKFNRFRTGNWHNITKRKFEIIHKELQENEFVCFTDGDIVFLDKNFMKYCLDHINNNDMIIQNDTLSNSSHQTLCSGFMFIKSNKNTLNIFNPKNVEQYVRPGWDDQIYINEIKSKIKYSLLPLDLFPNGQYFYNSQKKNNMFNIMSNTKSNNMMIHFNWVIGHEKQNRMKKYNKWYV